MNIPQVKVAMPRFGERVKVNGGEAAAAISALTAGSTAMPLVSASALGSSATGTAGSVLQTGGTGLMSTGPQSSGAKTVLDAMNLLGSEGAAQWSVANPSLGGLAQIVVGSLLGGGGSKGASSSQTKLRSPN